MTDQPDPIEATSLEAYAHAPQRRVGRRAAFGVVAALLAAAALLFLPQPAGLTPEGTRTAALFLVALALWASEAIPIAVTSLLAIILQPVFQIADLKTAIDSSTSPVFFFVLAMFCISSAMVNTGLARRFGLWLLSHAGTDPRRVVLAFMVGTASVSTIISDVPTCAIFMAMALGVLEKMKAAPGSSSLGKSLMIGIPIASLIGGIGTPAGSSVNILGIHFIEQYGKVRVPFLSWMAIGMPMVLALVPISWWVIVRCFPPELPSVGSLDEVLEERTKLGSMTLAEKKVIALLTLMTGLWILSTWIRQLDLVLIAVVGAALMFVPGVRLLTWKEAERGTAWDTLLMISGVTALGASSVKTGLAGWLVHGLLGGMNEWHAVWIVGAISILTVLIHLVLPIGPVVNAVLIPPIALLALSLQQNPALYTVPVAFTASCAFLLPLDAVCLITYSKGYYRMLDMLRPGAIISAIWVILMTLLMILLAPALGFF